MPQIIVTTAGPDSNEAVEVHRERVATTDVATDSSSHLLVERIGWALSDAEDLESDGNRRERFPSRAGTITDAAVI